MSTRAHVAFYEEEEQPLRNWNALVYKHSDGYMEGVLPTLTEFCKKFNDHRGMKDAEYASARYVQALCNEHDGITKDIKERFGSKETFEFGTLGVGIAKQFHGDIEFFYAVYPDRIEVYETEQDDYFFNEVKTMQTFDGYVLKKIETVQF